MSAILGAVPTFSKLRGSKNDDWIDRMSHVTTVFILVIFAIVISTSQFVGHPIHCWLPAEYDLDDADWYEQYANHYCWISNTYVVHFDEQLPESVTEREDRQIIYYQWVPLILVFQAFLFKFPNVIWKLLHPNCGVNLCKLVDMAETTHLASMETRQDTITAMADYIDRWLNTERAYNHNRFTSLRERTAQTVGVICSKRSGTYLTGLYFWTKLLYVANVIGQFFLLNEFMSTDYNMYGFEVIRGLQTNNPWDESPRFPRVTFCDFEIRQLQNVNRFTIQCVLPINLFNEKIFIFMWFWLFFIAILCVYSLLKWFIFNIIRNRKGGYVRKYLKLRSNHLRDHRERKLCKAFVNQYLRDDGVFLLSVITNNSSDLVTTDLVNELWCKYLKDHERQSDGEADTMRNGGNVNSNVRHR